MIDVRTMTTSELVIRICDSAIDYDREKMIYELDRRIPVPNDPKKLDGWQPIETAPRDGSLVLVAFDRYPDFARWNKRTDHWETMVRNITPTHWMPLPEVPR